MQCRTAGIVLLALFAYSITVEGGQRPLPGSGKKQVWQSQRATNRAEPIVRPRASIGQAAGNTIKTTTFYDDDSGGEGDALVTFVAPQAGTYLLMVNDLTDATVGCYRYQIVIG